MEQWQTAANGAWAALLIDSFQRVLGKPLLNGAPEPGRLYHAPFVVVSHGTQIDPILNYGNAQALQLWELNWAKFTQTPSRLTAEPLAREERAALLEQVTRRGFIDNYRGVRISATGRRFAIEQAIVWNVIDAAGIYRGQGATFSNWTFL